MCLCECLCYVLQKFGDKNSLWLSIENLHLLFRGTRLLNFQDNPNTPQRWIGIMVTCMIKYTRGPALLQGPQ